MTFTLDPEVAAIMESMAAQMATAARLAVGDVAGRRAILEPMLAAMDAAVPFPADVTVREVEIPVGGGVIAARWYHRQGSDSAAACVFVHGGGMIMGNIDMVHGSVARYVSASGVPMLSVNYRLAPEFPYPVPVRDVLAAVQWLHGHATDLGVGYARIGIMGESAGGGIAAAAALIARDEGGPRLARQILIYPMLDDRNVDPDALLAPFAVWSYDDNLTGWSALVGAAYAGPDVPYQAAPARAEDLTGVPPTYLEVGQLDIFRDEVLDFGRRLSHAGVETELHLRPGVPHGFEALAPDTDVARRAIADRVRALTSL
ncbi:MAG: alpha/beta hydrolase [Acidimicrobiales bacterium]|jgi:acetyl esterase/lipase